MSACPARWLGIALAALGGLGVLACSGSRIWMSSREDCSPGGPAIPKPSLGSDPQPFRMQRTAAEDPRPGHSPRRYVYRFEREPSGTTETLRAIYIEHEGKPIAVGDRGTALLRDPKAGWTGEKTGTEENLYAVVRAPFRPEGPVSEQREANAPHIVVGARGTALARTALGTWRAEQTGTDRDLFGLWHLGTSTVAVGAGGTMVERSPEGTWQPVPTRTQADLFAVGPCSPHICVVGAGGMVVDCVRPQGKLVCIPRQVAAPADLRAISDDGTLYGHGVLLAPAQQQTEGTWSPPPAWKPSPYAGPALDADEIRAVWHNHWMGMSEQLAVGRGGVIWFLANRYERAKPFERAMLPLGVDFHGVGMDFVDGFLVGDRGTIVHLAVDGVDIPTICLL